MNPREQFGIRIQHAGIHVNSYEETYEWYHRVFGFEEIPSNNKGGKNPFGGGVFPKMRWLRLGDFNLEVYEVQNAEPFSLVDFEFTLGVKHINFEIQDLKGWMEYVKQFDDVEIVVFNRYSENSAAVYVKDNNGILVEVTTSTWEGGK